MSVLGTTIVYLEPEGSDTRPVMGIVTDDLGDQEILLSYSDMKDWGMLSKDFPRVPRTTEKVNKVITPRKNVKLPVGKRASAVKSPNRRTGTRTGTENKPAEKSDEEEAENLKTYLLKEFPDVFRETLGKEDRMAVDPAELVMINEDVEPHYRGLAREIPAHYLEESKAMINDLLEGGIISEVTKPVSWCTQGFFVPKPGTKKLRLVTDYREINKSLKRPEWPFLPSDAVRRQVDPGAKVFAALDLTSGYHQIKLSEEDKDLTTFTLPYGRYRYEVLPMGLKPSSDHFNINSDKAVKGLPGTLKSVDDMLTQGTSWADLKGKMTILFQRFRKLNMKLNPVN